MAQGPVVEEDERGKRRPSGGQGNRKGTPQGGVVSPLPANLHRHLLDRIRERHDLERRLGTRRVRYADDAAILYRGDPGPAMAVLESVVQRLELTLNREKTQGVDARETAFDFLGFSIEWARSRRTGKGYPQVEPRRRAEERIKARVKELAARRRALVPLPGRSRRSTKSCAAGRAISTAATDEGVRSCALAHRGACPGPTARAA